MLLPPKNARPPRRRAPVTHISFAKEQSGQAVRKAITRSKQTIRAAVPSTKGKRSIDCESGLESKFALYAEISPVVVDWFCQPFKIQLAQADSITTYTPDFKLTLRSGAIVIIEVKPLSRCLESSTLTKLRAAHHYFGEIGWEYKVFTDHDMDSSEYFQNLNLLRYYKRVPVNHARRVSVRKLVDNNEYLSIQELEKAGFNKPIIYSLIANNALSTDLSIPINPHSPIKLPEENANEERLFKGRSALDLA